MNWTQGAAAIQGLLETSVVQHRQGNRGSKALLEKTRCHLVVGLNLHLLVDGDAACAAKEHDQHGKRHTLHVYSPCLASRSFCDRTRFGRGEMERGGLGGVRKTERHGMRWEGRAPAGLREKGDTLVPISSSSDREPNSGIVTLILPPSPSVGLSSYELRGLQVHAVYKYMVAFVSCLVCA